MKIEEQEKVLQNDRKRMLISASAGSGKTHVMIEYICKLVCDDRIPIRDFLVLTFTKAAATEMKERLQNKLKEKGNDEYIIQQLDELSTANISTIHSFCEKCLKKYANLLELDENFSIIDENMSQKLRQDAFEKALKKFESECKDDFLEVMACYKNDKGRIKNILFEIENLTGAIADKEKFLQENLNESENFFKKATEFLCENSKQELERSLQQINSLHMDEFEERLREALQPCLNSLDLFSLCKQVQVFKWIDLPLKKEVGEEVVEKLNLIKKEINRLFAKLKVLKLDDLENVETQKSGRLEKILINLYNMYDVEEAALKNQQGCLDFSDLEKYMNKLSKQENLFANLKYVFVDEYQDTNKVQESIVKNVAKNCNFVAVGDVKQGIYGFRLASSEIFLKDLKEFDEDKNSAVRLLKSNFRSCPKVLSFVNDVFRVCITSKTSGVDYKDSLVPEGVTSFVEDGKKAINIDVIKKVEIVEDEKPEIYSVREAKLCENKQLSRQLLDIKRRIMEVMSSKISDKGQLRSCKYSDIAILSRKRDELFNQLETFLQNAGIPVVSNTKNSLLDEPEILMLINYLRLALKADDEVALLSVLLSGLYLLDVETLMAVKQDKNLCDLVFEENLPMFETFKQQLKEFRFDVQIYGAKKAFVNLFNKTGYRSYINLKPNQQRLNLFIDKFLGEIVSSELQFDIAGLIHHFDTVDITVAGEVSSASDAVLLTTIHNSKGLEYPIVFLIGCDRSLSKGRPKIDVEINENFGLALKIYDKANNMEVSTVRMLAIKESQAQKDFVEELMIFYVALTRAKNRLYLFGEYDEKQFKRLSVLDCDSYYDLIFFALQKQRNEFLQKQSYQDDSMEICFVEEVIEEKVEKQNFDFAEKDEKICKKIENYLDFSYKYDDGQNFKLKESVTALCNKNGEDVFAKYKSDSFNFSENFVEVGNAYHLALKLIDFDKVKDMQSLEDCLNDNKALINIDLIDKKILLENILLLKNIIGDGKIFKEKEFIMKEKISNLLDENSFEDEILVQGVVDLFVIKNNAVTLVDYKYSNAKNDDYLIKKYKNQLKLYKIAIENAFNLKVDEMYLLSLKNNKLIKIN